MNLEVFKNISPDIAVVGNSSCLLDREDGEVIDSHRYVARFNNYTLKAELNKLLGSKTNIWVTSFYLDIDWRANLGQFEAVFCPFPIYEVKYRDKYPVNSKLIDEFSPEIIPTSIYEELIERVPKPSTGIAFLWWLYKQYGSINPNSVFGFSFFKGKMHYFDESTFTTHKGDLEEQLFNDMVGKLI